jgi:hypothetical protein
MTTVQDILDIDLEPVQLIGHHLSIALLDAVKT